MVVALMSGWQLVSIDFERKILQTKACLESQSNRNDATADVSSKQMMDEGLT